MAARERFDRRRGRHRKRASRETRRWEDEFLTLPPVTVGGQSPPVARQRPAAQPPPCPPYLSEADHAALVGLRAQLEDEHEQREAFADGRSAYEPLPRQTGP